MEIFQEELKTNVVDFAKFYLKHTEKHFIQIGDYPVSTERPTINIPAASGFDSFSEYTPMYGFGAIIEQEIVASAADDIAANNFQLCVMDVPGSNNEYYIGFLQCPDLPDVRLNTEGKL